MMFIGLLVEFYMNSMEKKNVWSGNVGENLAIVGGLNQANSKTNCSWNTAGIKLRRHTRGKKKFFCDVIFSESLQRFNS